VLKIERPFAELSFCIPLASLLIFTATFVHFILLALWMLRSQLITSALERASKGVVKVESKNPSDEAGLQQGDVIISFNSHPIESVDNLFARPTAETIDSVEYLSILRDNQRKVLEIYPAEMRQTTEMRKDIRKSAVPQFRNHATNHRSVDKDRMTEIFVGISR
jgi:hypothetical protein